MRSKTFVRYMGFLEAKCEAVISIISHTISHGLAARPFSKGLTNQEYLEEEIAAIQVVIDTLKSTGAINASNIDKHYEKISTSFKNDQPILWAKFFRWEGDKNA